MIRTSTRVAAIATLVISAGPVGLASPASAATIMPTGVDATGASDDTAALQSLLDGLPDGSTLSFPPGGKYRIEGTLHVKDKHDLTIEGNGSLFFATTTGDRTRSQWSFEGGSNIVVRDVAVKGANPNAGTGSSAYVKSLEAQHAFNIWSTNGIELDHVSATDVYGDFVYIGPLAGGLAKNVYVHDSTFDRNGRQGISVTGGDGVRIIHNVISDVRRSTFDLEPNGSGWAALNVDIEDNTIGAGRLNLIASAGAGPVANITFKGNTINRPANIYVGATDGSRRGPFLISDNVATTSWGAPSGAAVFEFNGVDGLTVTGNHIPLQAGRGDYGVRALDSCDVTVSGNEFPGSVAPSRVTYAPSCAPSATATEATPTLTSQPPRALEPTQAPIAQPTQQAPTPPTAPVVTVQAAPTPVASIIAAPPQPPSPSQAGGSTEAGATSQAVSSSPVAVVQPRAKSSKKPEAVAGGSNKPKAGAAKAGADSSQARTDTAVADDSVYLDAAETPMTSDVAWSAHMRRRALYAGLVAMVLLLMGLRLRKTATTRHKAAAVRTVRHHPGLATIALRGPEIHPQRRVR